MKINLLFPSAITLITSAAIGLGWSGKSHPVAAAETSQQPDLAATLGVIDAHHQKAVEVFDRLPGFGFSRIVPVIRHDLKNAAPPEHKNLFSEHDFTFIGSDAAVRRNTPKNPVAPSEVAIFRSLTKGKTSVTPANDADLAALKALEADPESRRHFRIKGDAIISYGPLRATASCAKCHGVEEGTLLGMFRYRFDLQPDPRTALATMRRN